MAARGNLARLRAVRLLVLDVDGVLTDGGLHYGPDGEAVKRFDVKDGHGLVLLRELGIPAAILTARSSKIVDVRAKELGIRLVIQGARDKGAGFDRLLAETGVPPGAIAYAGDDVNDLPVLERVGLAACPADARPEVKRAVHLVLEAPGGRGAVRELCEAILKAQGRWGDALDLAARRGAATRAEANKRGPRARRAVTAARPKRKGRTS